MHETRQPAAEVGRSARERILDAAYELFSRRGIQAVGVNEVIEHAGVATATLYRHFPSKDEARARVPRPARTALDQRPH